MYIIYRRGGIAACFCYIPKMWLETNAPKSMDVKILKKLILCLCVLFTAVLLLAGSAAAAISDADFLELCTDGTSEVVEKAIKDGANVNAVDED